MKTVPLMEMTLRDHFACAAMQAMIGSHRIVNTAGRKLPNPSKEEMDDKDDIIAPHWDLIFDGTGGDAGGNIAENAYIIADTMLRWRVQSAS